MSDDFYSWKRHPITVAIMSEYRARIAQLVDELVESAGKEPVVDGTKAGAIKAYRDVLNITYDEIEHDSSSD